MAPTNLARRGRLLARSDTAAVVTLVPDGLQVEESDPPGHAPAPGAVLPLPPSMAAVVGLLAAGHLRWSRLPAGPDQDDAAIVSLPRMGRAGCLLVVANRDRRQPLDEMDLQILSRLGPSNADGAIR